MLLNAPVFWFKLIDSDTDEKFDQIQELIENGTVNTMNYKGSIAKLRRQSNEKS